MTGAYLQAGASVAYRHILHLFLFHLWFQDVEQDVEQTEKLREDIVIAHNENVALKRIMLGKDCLVIQKSKALDLAKVY